MNCLKFSAIFLAFIILKVSVIQSRPQLPISGLNANGMGQSMSQNINAGPFRIGVAEGVGVGMGPSEYF